MTAARLKAYAADFCRRANFARRSILQGEVSSREFDSCFEMYDGDYVAAALLRHAGTDQELAAALQKHLGPCLALWRERAQPLQGWAMDALPGLAARHRLALKRRGAAWQEQHEKQLSWIDLLSGAEKIASCSPGTQLGLL